MGARKLWRMLPFIAALAAIAATYVWTTRSNNLAWNFGAEQKDYYNLLVHGFLDGHLSLKTEVPAALVNAENPYDPAKRPEGIALHDASLYRGKYYIYYGVVPAVVALLPFRAITGIDLPVPVAVLGFALASYVVVLCLIADLRHRYFPRCGPIMTFLLAVGYGFASCSPILLRRSSMYEVPITCGSLCAWCALGSLYLALLGPNRRVAWLAASSLFWGLAIGCRPTYLFAPLGLIFACPILFRDANGKPVSRRRAIQLLVAGLVPIGAVGLLLAVYNYERFGSPTEFGVSYILSGVYEAKIEHFRLRYVPWNIRGYFFAVGEWGRYFPFFHPRTIAAPLPFQHYGMDHPFGLLVNVPLIWLGVFAMCGGRGALHDPSYRVRRTLLGAMLWWAIAVSGLVVCFYAAMARYLGDFAPALALLGVVGAMTLIERAAKAGERWRRVAVAALVGVLVAISAFVVAVVSLQIYGRLRVFNPVRYAALARIANAPVHGFESLAGAPKGALELRIEFAGELPVGRREELVRTGWGEEKDRVFVEYPDAGHIRLAYEHAGGPAVASEPMPVDRSVAHVVAIRMGSLFPPTSWPGYRTWTAEQVARVVRRLEIKLDGATVLERYQRFYGGADGALTIAGRNASQPFSGKILRVAREEVMPPSTSAADASRPSFRASTEGVWRLAVRFPARPAGTREPLIVSGETGRGDFLAIEYLADNRFRLILDHWGSRALFSEPIVYEPGRDYAVEIGHAAFRSESGAANMPSELVIRLDGREVWRVTAMLYLVAPEDVFVGFNPIGGSSCAERFIGKIEPAPEQ